MPELKRISGGTDPTTLITELEKNGCVIVEGFLGADTVKALNADFDSAIAATAPGVPNCENEDHREFFGKKTIRIDGLAARSPTFQGVICHELMLGMADHFLLPNCENYILNAAQLIEMQPGQPHQVLHRDEDIWNCIPTPHFMLEVEAMIALTDFSETVGATRVVPGSHLWDEDKRTDGSARVVPGSHLWDEDKVMARVPTEHEIENAEMPAGSAVFYLGNTMHGGGANQSEDVRRRGLFLGFCLGWLRTEENFYLSTPIEAVRNMPEKVQKLLGYDQHFGLGAVEIGTPMNILKRS